MTMFGLKEAVVAPLLRAVAGEELPASQLPDRFARAAWTGIAEPGDRVAGRLVGALGAADALTTLVERWTGERVLAALAAAGGEELEGEELLIIIQLHTTGSIE